MGFINAAFNNLINQRIDWPSAQSLDVEEFVRQTIDEIRWQLGVGEDDGRQVAIKIWKWLRSD